MRASFPWKTLAPRVPALYLNKFHGESVGPQESYGNEIVQEPAGRDCYPVGCGHDRLVDFATAPLREVNDLIL